jgi:hypothetical protein
MIGVPPILDAAAHSITYPVDGSAFRLHSEPAGPFEAARSFEEWWARTRTAWDASFFQGLRDQLIEALSGEGREKRRPELPGVEGPVAHIATLLERIGAVLALFPDPEMPRFAHAG